MKECTRCGMKKNWEGQDPKCPFQNGEDFSTDNWNCGQIGKIRDFYECSVSGMYKGIHHHYIEDTTYLTISLNDIELRDEPIGLVLYVEWYKRRGRTDAMWILDGEAIPRVPTFEEINTIVDFYNIK